MNKILFANVCFDIGRRELSTAGEPAVQLRPLPAIALQVMLETPNQSVSKETLIEKCWSSNVVTDQALTNVISKLRKSLLEIRASGVKIKTITKLGYMVELDGDVEYQINEVYAQPILESGDRVHVENSAESVQAEIQQPIEAVIPSESEKKNSYKAYILLALMMVASLFVILFLLKPTHRQDL